MCDELFDVLTSCYVCVLFCVLCHVSCVAPLVCVCVPSRSSVQLSRTRVSVCCLLCDCVCVCERVCVPCVCSSCCCVLRSDDVIVADVVESCGVCVPSPPPLHCFEEPPVLLEVAGA